MSNPFDSAWALLKTNINGPPINQHFQQMMEFLDSVHAQKATENQPYPLTPEEERFREKEERAYAMATEAIPRPPDMTDEQYGELIEEPAERVLAEMMGKKATENQPYPWPKKHPFQTTFENDGSINRDPKVAQQRRFNAGLNRDSMRREAVPSRIEIVRDPRSKEIRNYSLVNNEGEMISRLTADMRDKNSIDDFYGETKEPYRRQGMYRKLMQALIGAGIPIKSDERNYQSNPFHQNLLESLPPNIESSYVDAYGNPTTENSVEDLNPNTPLHYYQNKVPQFLDAQGQRSGLNRQDYGAIPIINQENQARNMDELAEQDSAKIRRGQGHIAERLEIPEWLHSGHAIQPMARNTQQITFDDFFERQNNFQ